MGKVKTINPEEQELKAKEKAQKEAERLAKIEAAKEAGRAKKEKAEPNVILESETNQRRLGEASTESSESGVEVKADAGQDGMTDSSETEITAEPKAKKKVSKYAAKQKGKTRERSEKYLASAKMIDKSKLYSVKEALELLEKTHLAKFDETVELHINTAQAGLSGQVTLPHGTGKSVRVAVLNPSKDSKAADDLLKEIELGKITFDILIATPDAMPKLAKVAKVLGPKGLMPNPKAGTVTTNPDAIAKQYEGGQMHYKTEAKTPVMHVAVGKLSFGEEKLSQNIAAFLKAVKLENIKKVVVKSTMSPAIKLRV